MAFVAAAVGGGALLGAIGGSLKSGPDANMYGRDQAQKAMEAYRNLVAKGPGEADVGNAYNASKDYANTLNNVASRGLYDTAAGNRLAEQQFAGQRQALAQSIQDQMAVANRAASAAGRSSNDPILRARLGAEAMRQTASMNAQQSSAAMDLGRQATTDMLSLQGQRVNTLQGLAEQAFAGQQNLFGMGQNLFSMDMGAAQYEQSRGGGLKGAITGAITGAGAGMQMATGFSGMSNATNMTNAGVAAMNRMGAPAPVMGPAPAMAPAPVQAAPAFNPAYFNPANFAQGPASLPASSVPRYGPSDLNYMRSYFSPFSLPSAPNGALGAPNSFLFK